MQLSPSKLSVFNSCKQCFYFENRLGILRPRGIFPSLPGGMDRVIKADFDMYRRVRATPPALKSLVEKRQLRLFQDQQALDKMRNWRSGLAWNDTDGNRLIGAIDDLLVKKQENFPDHFIPFDYKTKGSEANIEDATKYYQSQLELYGLLLHENGYEPVADFGVLIFYSPEAVTSSAQHNSSSALRSTIAFKTQIFKIPIDIERARTTFREAISLLNIAKLPSAGADCEYCHFAEVRQSFN